MEPNVEAEVLGDGRTVYVASHPDVLGILAQADTAVEATRIWWENLRDYIKHVQNPRPKTAFTWSGKTYWVEDGKTVAYDPEPKASASGWTIKWAE
jgi:hypothetical protein